MKAKAPNEKSEEFSRFERLAKKLVSVPKKDLSDSEKKEIEKKAKIA